MKKRNIILLTAGLVPIITGLLCNTMFMPVPGISTFLMICGPLIWLAVCIAAADRKGKVFTQSLLLFAVGIVMIVAYVCYQAFWIEQLGITSPLNTLPQYYLTNCVLLAGRIYGLFEPAVWTSGPMLAISAVLTCLITFAGVFVKTRFKNVEDIQAAR